MNELRAFVGHSFTEDDSDIVAKFLKYLDQLSKTPLRFSWEHAEPAEPKELSEKVLNLMADKNVFIAICTRKERVILPELLMRPMFHTNTLRGKQNDFGWKTSDWIIQEIGLARGRNLEMILLVENGVRQPGGLQGSIEYISFDRSEPEKSFGKILEMLTDLAPKVSGVSATASDREASPEAEGAEESGTDELSVPKPNWRRKDYEFALLRAIADENRDQEEAIGKAYFESADGSERDASNRWTASAEYWRLFWAKGGSLAKLKSLAEAHLCSAGTLENLAKGFKYKKRHAEAASVYEAAANNSDGEEALRLLRQAAMQHAEAGARSNSDKIVGRMKTDVQVTSNGELELLRTIKDLADRDKDSDVAIATMERIAELDPDDNDVLFSLGYKYSEADKHDVALFTYLRIPERDRDSVTWNNLGVAYQEAKLVAKAVEAYQKAATMENTLSMGNLAEKFLGEGFLIQAQGLCDKALSLKEYHQKIGYILTQLQEIPENESKLEASLIQQGTTKSTFYKALGRAFLYPDELSLAGHWQGPDCQLNAGVIGTAFKAVGTYERSSLAGALSSVLGIPHTTTTRFEVTYNGTIRGRTVECNVKRGLAGEPSSPTTLFDTARLPKALIVLSDDGTQMQVMEEKESGAPSFYSLHRIKDKGGQLMQ